VFRKASQRIQQTHATCYQQFESKLVQSLNAVVSLFVVQ